MPRGPKTKVDAKGRICTKCNKYKLWSEFHWHLTATNNCNPSCKECCNKYRRQIHRYEHLKHTYDLTEPEYEVLLKKQNGVCAICSEKPEENLSVDHCHVTGEIRGLLCRKCNSSIGLLKHDVKLLLKAIQYLENRRVKNLLTSYVFILVTAVVLTYMMKTCVDVGVEIEKGQILSKSVDVLAEQIKLLRIQNSILQRHLLNEPSPADPTPESDHSVLKPRFSDASWRMERQSNQRLIAL